MELSFLKKLISKAPTGPGIYIFAGHFGKKSRFVSRSDSIEDPRQSRDKARLTNRGSSMPAASGLYIGKASNLKARLSSYLKTTDQRILQMLSRASDIKTLETGSEIEALILESQYIKKHKPAFNIMLRDDKQFFYVVFTKEMFPKIFITHQSTPLGPFTDGTALKTTLKYLRRIFPYCTCKKPHNNLCLNYHIGKCPGFCCLKNVSYDILLRQQGGYLKNIKAIKEILSGKKNSLLKKLEKEMVALGKKEGFKEAIELRDKIEKIKRVFENARIIKNQNFPYYDISKNHNETAPSGLKKVLGLKKIPARIEGYDVANIQGKYAVGAMVVFTDGKPDRNEYRKFKVRAAGKADDTGMLKEILKRRSNHPEWQMPDLILIDGGKAQLNAAHSVVKKILPILSASQKSRSKDRGLSMQSEQNRGSSISQPNFSNLGEIGTIIALTKDDKHRGSKIYTTGRKSPTPLSQLPTPFKNLLLQVDSEAHRFAISYYRRLHRRTIK